MLTEMDTIDRLKKTTIHQIKLAKEKGIEATQEQQDKIVECIKNYNELKKKYVDFQNDTLYEKWVIDEKKGRTEETKTNTSTFITFRSMEGKNRAMKIFKYAEELAKQDKEEESKAFFG